MDDIKVSGHTDERVFAGDEDDLLVVGRPCGGLDTAVYAADDLDLCQCGRCVSEGQREEEKTYVWVVESEGGDVSAGKDDDERAFIGEVVERECLGGGVGGKTYLGR